MIRLLTSLLLLALLTAPTIADTVVKGTASADLASLDHPLGLADEPSSLVRSGSLDLTATTRDGASFWRWSYAGSLDLFDEDVPLDFMRHAVGIERIISKGSGRPASGGGMRFTVRSQLEDGALYDHTEVDGYLTRKSYPAPDVMLRGVLGFRIRSYADLPEESFVEPHGLLEVKRFSESRTALGAAVRLGGKWFNDPVAPAVWGTLGTPKAAQLTVAANVSQGVSDRIGLRASAALRLSLADFPHWVQEDLVDNPLLDRYARSGPTASAAMKILTPGAAWLEIGGRWSEDDYGEILFDDGDGVTTRRDTVLEGYASLEKSLSGSRDGALVRATVSWRDQSSDAAAYDWSGTTASAGVAWRW